jgi:nitronate monooxygenase
LRDIDLGLNPVVTVEDRMRTWLTERFGVTVPVISAPMAGVAGGALAAAVSQAGALGMVGVGGRTTPDWIRRECAIAAAAGRPYGVGLQAWALAQVPGQVDAVLEAAPALVAVSYGPYVEHLARLQGAGLVVATTVGNLREAREAQDAGVDLIVARGLEGGGHGRDHVATLPLLQSVLDAVAVPVLAAGGIATSRGLAAVLAAGAAGAWVGSAFLTCVEGTTTPEQRGRLIAATDTDTVYGRVFDIGKRAGWPREWGERALRNAFFDRWAGHEDELAADDGAAQDYAAHAAAQDFDVACVQVGQGVASLTAERTAAEVVQELARADDLLGRFSAR